MIRSLQYYILASKFGIKIENSKNLPSDIVGNIVENHSFPRSFSRIQTKFAGRNSKSEMETYAKIRTGFGKKLRKMIFVFFFFFAVCEGERKSSIIAKKQ